MKILKSVLIKLGLIPAATIYHYLSIKNRYPCRVVGERINNNIQETIVIYKVSPRKEEFEINLKDLLDIPLLIEKFHPTEAVRLGFMAFGDIFFHQSKKEAYIQYKEIIKKMGSRENQGDQQ